MNYRSAAMSRFWTRQAEKRRCPQCQRKAALSAAKKNQDTGEYFRTCRYCGSIERTLYP